MIWYLLKKITVINAASVTITLLSFYDNSSTRRQFRTQIEDLNFKFQNSFIWRWKMNFVLLHCALNLLVFIKVMCSNCWTSQKTLVWLLNEPIQDSRTTNHKPICHHLRSFFFFFKREVPPNILKPVSQQCRSSTASPSMVSCHLLLEKPKADPIVHAQFQNTALNWI